MKYTNFWVDDFNQEKVDHYDKKWFVRFEKNLKHVHQLKLLRKIIKNDISWLDFL